MTSSEDLSRTYSRLTTWVVTRWTVSMKRSIPVEMDREPRARPVRKLIWI
jgi:hypothetical protein